MNTVGALQISLRSILILSSYLLCAGIAQSVQRLVTGWTVRGSNPVGGEIFRTRPDRPWGPPSLLYNGYRVFPEGKAAGEWRWSPTPIWSRGRRKNRAIHLLPLWVFVACYRVTFTFTFYPYGTVTCIIHTTVMFCCTLEAKKLPSLDVSVLSGTNRHQCLSHLRSSLRKTSFN